MKETLVTDPTGTVETTEKEDIIMKETLVTDYTGTVGITEKETDTGIMKGTLVTDHTGTVGITGNKHHGRRTTGTRRNKKILLMLKTDWRIEQ